MKLPLILVYWEEVRRPFWPLHPSHYLSALCFYFGEAAIYSALPRRLSLLVLSEKRERVPCRRHPSAGVRDTPSARDYTSSPMAHHTAIHLWPSSTPFCHRMTVSPPEHPLLPLIPPVFLFYRHPLTSVNPAGLLLAGTLSRYFSSASKLHAPPSLEWA